MASTERSAALPRGPHRLSREEVAGSQRTRLLAAFTELLAERGYAGVTIGELVGRARVSRGAFYELFADKQACLLAAYDDWAAELVAEMTRDVAEDTPWEGFIAAALGGYLGALERDPVAARAFIVEMDAAGSVARARRREAINAFAALIQQRHEAMRARNPELGALPRVAYVGLALGVREIVREELERRATPKLSGLAPEIQQWVAAMVAGAG
jgi:AcrR family transcriptional regulator